ncbi:hypothetical protein TRAPUB_4968 [Trametes pubescens]|uniref:Uncharacterized protein n=1 Tax=Trametes pubescens TaxID=154538 RepID=A0A1M2V9P9_TRAPU|nr:hypothetical protein TRAPUB_4968 [Trametes pubescens]
MPQRTGKLGDRHSSFHPVFRLRGLSSINYAQSYVADERQSSEDSKDLGDSKNLENMENSEDSEDSEDAGGSDDELPERAEPYKQPPPTSYQTHQTSPSKGKGKLVATPRPYVPYSFRRRYKPVSSMDDVASALRQSVPSRAVSLLLTPHTIIPENTGSGGAPEDVRVSSFVHIPISSWTFLRRRVPPKPLGDDCECTICVRALAKRLEDAAPFAERRDQLLAASQGLAPWYAGSAEGMSMTQLYGPGVPPPFEVPWRVDDSASVPSTTPYDPMKGTLIRNISVPSGY